MRGGVEGFVGVVGFSLGGDGPVAPMYPPTLVRRASLRLRFEPRKRSRVGIWINNCGPRRAALADLLLGSGLRVESYGKCRHNTTEGLAHWQKVGRLHEANNNPNDETYQALGACRRHRVILAEENELCPGYYTWDLLNAINLCGAIPIIFTVDGLPDYEAELGPFPHVNATKRGWLQEVSRIVLDDDYYRDMLAGFQNQTLPPPPGAGFEERGDFHCQWHDLGLPNWPRKRVHWPRCADCQGWEESGHPGDGTKPEVRTMGEVLRIEGGRWTREHGGSRGEPTWRVKGGLWGAGASGLSTHAASHAPYRPGTCNFSRAWAMG